MRLQLKNDGDHDHDRADQIGGSLGEELRLMRLNLAPFVDLFSILAIGLFLLMVVTTGTEKPEPDVSDIVIVKLFPNLFGSGSTERFFQSMVDIQPYYLRGDVEVSREELSVLVITRQEPDRVEVMVRGRTGELGVGFRVAEVRDVEVLYDEVDMEIVRIRPGEHVARRCRQRLGLWRDPVVCVGDSCADDEFCAE